jgi:hypothetical protein
MYVVTSTPFVNRTRATFRSAEFGFLGVEVYTRVQTPRFCGQLLSAGLEVFQRGGFRPIRTSWLKVGTNFLSVNSKNFLSGATTRDLKPQYIRPQGISIRPLKARIAIC